MRHFICFFIIASVLFACHSKSSSSSGAAVSNGSAKFKTYPGPRLKPPAKGRVIDSVFCAGDSSQKYSIYLPTKYDTSKKWPIIYFFDPHGVGNLPIELYKGLAEKYGFIIAGTYNSKNGLQWENSQKAAEELMKDTWMRLSLDNTRLYTAGFSGGAKVASLVAITDGGISGVIACGGGFPEEHPPIKQPFSFISFVGNKDFNNMPVRQLDKMLDSTNIPHQLIVFNGKHQWPPVSYMEQAFQWLDVDAMRNNSIPKNDSIIQSIKLTILKEAQYWQKIGDVAQEYYAYKKLLNFLRDLDDVGKYATILQNLENSDKLQKYFKDEDTFEAQEAQELLEFRAHLSQVDLKWWENKIAIMQNQIANDTSSPASIQTQRILSYLSLVMYMGAINEFNARNYPAASYFVTLYTLVDPSNPEHSYLNACLYMTNHNSAKAISYLKDAVKLGFSDSRRLRQDSNFVSLYNSPEYKILLKEMAAKPKKLDMTQ